MSRRAAETGDETGWIERVAGKRITEMLSSESADDPFDVVEDVGEGLADATRDDRDWSRRSFLRAVTAGAAGVTALALSGSAAALTFRSDRTVSFFNESSSTPTMELAPDGTLDLDEFSSLKLNGVAFPETARQIQDAIDRGMDVIQLLPNVYKPDFQIEIKDKVILQGRLPDRPDTAHAQTVIDGTDSPSGVYMIRFRDNNEERTAMGSQIRNLVVHGRREMGKRVGGIEVGFFGRPQLANVVVRNCYHPGTIFSGTQSGQCPYLVVSDCGNAANDEPGIDLGGEVGSPDDLNRATIKGAVYAETLDRSDAVPIKLRTGSTLFSKQLAARTGTYVKDTDVPGLVVDGGNFVGEVMTFSSNGNVAAPAIRVWAGSGVGLERCIVERCDPGIEFNGGSLSLSYCTVRDNVDNGNRSGHGLWMTSGGKGSGISVRSSAFLNNAGDGIIGGKHIYEPMIDVQVENNGGYGANAVTGYGMTIIGLWRRPGAEHANGNGLMTGGVEAVTPPSVHRNRNAGQAALSPDGSKTVFTVQHGMDEAPVNVRVTPRNADARDAPAYHVDNRDASGFDLVFASAPASSTVPVFDWKAYGDTAYLRS